MLLAAVLALGLADPVTIYVGPHVEEGFVNTDRGVKASVSDIRSRLSKRPKQFTVVTDESSALLRLYVSERGISGPTGGGASVRIIGGTTIHVPAQARYIASVLRVRDFERPFVGEDTEHDTWGRCADLLVRDLSVWVAANYGRVTGQY